jgi:integrase
MQIGAPLFPDTPTALMAKLLRKHNAEHREDPLPVMRLHDLRHVHATLLLKAGVPVHVVAARLGHADPAITLSVYAHVLRDQASEVADVFARLLEGD